MPYMCSKITISFRNFGRTGQLEQIRATEKGVFHSWSWSWILLNTENILGPKTVCMKTLTQMSPNDINLNYIQPAG